MKVYAGKQNLPHNLFIQFENLGAGQKRCIPCHLAGRPAHRTSFDSMMTMAMRSHTRSREHLAALAQFPVDDERKEVA